jgi:hypothetical protein
MFGYSEALPHLLLPVLFGLLGAAAGAIAGRWVQRWIRSRRLLKLGFSRDDLISNEQFFEKWGQITAAKVPLTISFSEITSHSWSNPRKYGEFKAELEALGFQRSSAFVASPQKWVAEFWLCSDAGLFAKIIDSKQRGVYLEVTVIDSDDSVSSFENTEECGLRHREPDKWAHCGLISASQLVEQALLHRQRHSVKQMNLAECVNAYENAVNEYNAWRRKVGISGIEMRRAFELYKKRRSLREDIGVESASHK